MSATSTILSVTELTTRVKSLLESNFGTLTIQGEITNFKPNVSGHTYFDLKDAGAKISAVMFRTQGGALSRLPKEGDQVIVKGHLALYPPHGKYQIIVSQLQFAGVGELLLKLEELKKKLAAQGWFDKEHKKPLPSFPKRIGVVTSPTGSVIRDIIHVLTRRYQGFLLILNPVRVQGNEAAEEIAKAIEDFNRLKLADVLIVCRGGGSLEDLWPFNEERVAEAIFRSKLPIISAVGHETDFTIADFVSDVRAPTPSAAAEIVTAEKMHHLQFLEKSRLSLQSALSHLLKQTREKLLRFSKHPLLSTPYAVTGHHMQRLDEMKKELDRFNHRFFREKKLLLLSKQKELQALKPTAQLVSFRQRLLQFEKRLDQSAFGLLHLRKERVKQMIQTLHSLDPKNVLKRGYSILFARNRASVIVSAKSLAPQDEIRAMLADGEALLTVVKIDDNRRD